ncbi:hypothetical protein UPYG_G00073870 [Umbra pygmaea]|uniref:Uncharacterized protein n=1 Tax=Umbra pygmaea TaxID=75934 RepID=A0ABD0XCH9_UMBPY
MQIVIISPASLLCSSTYPREQSKHHMTSEQKSVLPAEPQVPLMQKTWSRHLGTASQHPVQYCLTASDWV